MPRKSTPQIVPEEASACEVAEVPRFFVPFLHRCHESGKGEFLQARNVSYIVFAILLVKNEGITKP